VRLVTAGGYDLEEIRRRADIVDIVSVHVRLRRAGRRLVGLCPFHQERTPSFTLDPEAGLWHCFGCKAGGDLFRFVEMIEKTTFAEAVELLARRFGVEPTRPADSARQQQRQRLLELHEEAARLFQAALRRKAGDRARAYLESRGLSHQAIEEFGLGYAPPAWDALLKAMAERGFTAEELVRAGLAVPREGGFYDRFRDRVIFPIGNASGRVVAFGGRLLDTPGRETPDAPMGPKYMNSPETPIFQKGRLLYAFDRARRGMADAGRAIVVEGYLDVIACHEAGFSDTVATMGTALTADHVELLRRRVDRLVLAFDSDSAGLAAALRSRDLFLQAGLTVRVVDLPNGADPDRVIRGRGAEAFGQLIESAAPIIEWQLTRILEGARSAGKADATEALRRAIAVLAEVPAGVDREYYVRWLVERWGPNSATHTASLENAVREELARQLARTSAGRRRIGQEAARGGGPPDKPPPSRVQAGLLAALLQHGDLAARYGPKLEPDDFTTEHQRGIFAAIRQLLDRQQPVTPGAVLEHLSPDARAVLAELTASDVPEERVEESVASGVRRALENRIRRRVLLLKAELDKVEPGEEQEAILRELDSCRRQLSELAAPRIVGEP
jgi:DNA primase